MSTGQRAAQVLETGEKPQLAVCFQSLTAAERQFPHGLKKEKTNPQLSYVLCKTVSKKKINTNDIFSLSRK